MVPLLLDLSTPSQPTIRKTILELSDIIEVCDEGFGYTSTLIINAISELLNFNFENSENTCELFGELNNRMRYGLPSKKSVNIYESGFNDRVVALKLATALRGVEIKNKQHFKKIANNNRSILLDVIADFPSIYTDRLENL